MNIQPEERKPGAGHWMPVEGSNDQPVTALTINDRNIKYEFSPTATDVSIESILEDFFACCQLTGDALLQNMSDVLSRSYVDEEAFDKALFEALKDCFADADVHEINNNSFVLTQTFSMNGLLAVGFSRQLSKTDLNIPAGWGGTRQNRYYHSCVIFSRATAISILVPLLCTSIADLKMNNSSVGELRSADDDMLFEPQLDGAAGALGQSLAYTLTEVWTCLARMGDSIVLPSPVSLPYASVPACVIAAKRNTCKETAKARFVQAALLIPQRCGAKFAYTVSRYASFADSGSVALAAKCYLAQLTFGFRMAESFMKNHSNFNPSIVEEWPRPRPLSGLQPPAVAREISYIGMAARMLPRRGIIPENLLATSQADIWEATMTRAQLNELQQSSNGSVVFSGFLFRDPPPLLVKISCRAVHNQIVSPAHSRLAMCSLREKRRLHLLKGVLLSFHHMPRGITLSVMKDLRAENYTTLRPQDYAGEREMPALWTAFSDLVMSKLVPLAKLTIVHTDLRPGYDETANIMVLEEKKRSFQDYLAQRDPSIVKYQMELIDLESLIEMISLAGTIPDLYKRYLPFTVEDPLTFVWWQVFMVGYSWLLRVVGNSFNMENITAELIAQAKASNRSTPTKLIVNGEKDVEKLLKDIGLLFAVNDPDQNRINLTAFVVGQLPAK